MCVLFSEASLQQILLHSLLQYGLSCIINQCNNFIYAHEDCDVSTAINKMINFISRFCLLGLFLRPAHPENLIGPQHPLDLF